MDALVLAGGPFDDLAAHTPHAPNKAFVEIAGVTLVERTLKALREAKSIGRIIVVAPPSAHAHPALALADELRPDGVRVESRARVSGQTGVEMEALTAAAVAGLTLIDMVKAVEKGVYLENVRLLAKSGGKSGDWTAPRR